jgi:hypothetical protein
MVQPCKISLFSMRRSGCGLGLQRLRDLGIVGARQ